MLRAMTRLSTLLLLTTTFLSPLATAQPWQTGDIEAIYGYLVTSEGIRFQVQSTGCTVREDFQLSVADGVLTLVRVAPDACFLFMPVGTEIFVPWSEVASDAGIEHFPLIGNPLSTHAAFAEPSGDASVPTTTTSAVTTIADALVGLEGSPLLLTGFLWGRGSDLWLCETLLETMPPHCGEPSIQVIGLDVSEIPGGFASHEDLRWSSWVTLSGTLVAGHIASPRVVPQ